MFMNTSSLKCLGTRRRKVLVPHDSTALLNQLRQEEKERERDARRQQIEGKRQQQLAFTQELYDWEDSLLGPGGLTHLHSMWEVSEEFLTSFAVYLR